MTDREQKIMEIREALQKATPGPWKWVDSGGYARKALVGEWEIMNFGASMPYSEVAGQEPDDADAHLIANSQEWLQFLLDELDSLRESLAEWIGDFEALRQDRDRLRQERDKLIEGLRWYADKTNYVQEIHHFWHGTLIEPAEAIYYDGGQRARDILKEIGVMVE